MATSEPQPGRARLGWVHLLLAVAVGAALGVAVHASPALLTAASDGPAPALEALADEYLRAIADGQADRASELVPLGVGRDPAPQPVLESAWRIRPLDVGPAWVDGDEATIDVRYLVGGSELEMQLRASQVDGTWQLTTSLAEAPDTSSSDRLAVLRIAGVPLPRHDELYLYPGVYRLEAVEGPLFRTGSGSFVIDGDPATSTQLRATARLMGSFEERLVSLAVGALEACTLRPTCPVRAQATFEAAGDPALLEALADGRMIDLRVPLLAREGSVWEWRAVVVRIDLDSRGLPVEWRCTILGDAAGVLPCGP